MTGLAFSQAIGHKFYHVTIEVEMADLFHLYPKVIGRISVAMVGVVFAAAVGRRVTRHCDVLGVSGFGFGHEGAPLSDC